MNNFSILPFYGYKVDYHMADGFIVITKDYGTVNDDDVAQIRELCNVPEDKIFKSGYQTITVG